MTEIQKTLEVQNETTVATQVRDKILKLILENKRLKKENENLQKVIEEIRDVMYETKDEN